MTAGAPLPFEPPGYPDGAPWPADDLAFARAVVDDVVALLDGDPDRVYAVGFSNGGVFAMRLASQLTGVAAAVASQEAPMQHEWAVPDPTVPVSSRSGRARSACSPCPPRSCSRRTPSSPRRSR